MLRVILLFSQRNYIKDTINWRWQKVINSDILLCFKDKTIIIDVFAQIIESAESMKKKSESTKERERYNIKI